MQSKSTVPNKEDWVNRKWRPAMAWMYMAICIFDFMLAPVLNWIFFSKTGGDFISWKPLTMGEGGMFHMAMGVVIGVTAWQRGEEKKTRYRVNQQYDEEYYDEDRSSYRDRIARDSFREDR